MTLSTKLSTVLSTSLSTVLSGGDGATLPPLVAPDAGVDSGTWVDTAQTLNGSAATGGSGSYTHLWTVQSGGAGTFTDATVIDAVFKPSYAAAAVVLRLTATDDVTLETAYDEVTAAG